MKNYFPILVLLFILVVRESSLAKLTEGYVMTICSQALYLIFILSAPMLLGAMVVGLIIGLLQALTSVQEQTLSFVPKLFLTFILLLMFIPFIVDKMDTFTVNLFKAIVQIGRSH